jgi:UDP-N-acetylmuramate dehydrogenase
MLTNNQPMSKHCSFKAGGLAKYFFTPKNLDELVTFLQNNTKNILMLGLGSNLLVRDKGFNGVVIKLKFLNNITIKNNIVQAQSGVTLAKLARFCQQKNLNGSQFLSAIPGSVGGALAMNAGAFGSQIWSFVNSVTTINHKGLILERKVSDFDIGYRQVINKNKQEYFISGAFEFNKKPEYDPKNILKKRKETQPIGQASCGSVFKNPKNHHAAKLIEQSNLKGFCIGGACISNKHANFIINKNNATATDIEKLIIYIQQTVKSKFNIDLETELVIK